MQETNERVSVKYVLSYIIHPHVSFASVTTIRGTIVCKLFVYLYDTLLMVAVAIATYLSIIHDKTCY